MYTLNMLTRISTKLFVSLFPAKRRKITLTLFITFAFLLVNANKLNAQATGDYRSAASGPWESAANWQRYSGTVWLAAAVAPSSVDGVITVLSPHSITLNASRALDQTVINSGATLQVNSGTLTISNGLGTDLDINGSILWATGALLNVSAGALVNGAAANLFYRGATLTNNGTINLNSLGMEPDPGSITINGVGNIATLTMANTSGVTLGGDQTITTLLNFNNGNLSTGTNKLILATTATVQHACNTHLI